MRGLRLLADGPEDLECFSRAVVAAHAVYLFSHSVGKVEGIQIQGTQSSLLDECYGILAAAIRLGVNNFTFPKKRRSRPIDLGVDGKLAVGF